MQHTIKTPEGVSREDALMHYMSAVRESPESIRNAANLIVRKSRLRIGFDGLFQAGRTQFEFDDVTAFLTAHDDDFVEGVQTVHEMTSSVLHFSKFIRQN